VETRRERILEGGRVGALAEKAAGVVPRATRRSGGEVLAGADEGVSVGGPQRIVGRSGATLLSNAGGDLQGGNYNAFEWEIHEATVEKECAMILKRKISDATVMERGKREQEEQRERDQEAQQYPTLDEYLEAERKKRLWAPRVFGRHAGVLLAAVKSPHASQFWSARRDRDLRCPRVCRTCGKGFTWGEPGQRLNSVRCAKCRPCRRGRGSE
jgi:hypothetical protein